MKKIVSVLIFLVLVGSIFVTASAATFYCDNDRDSSMYTCINGTTGGWTYYSGHTGDWHNDHRRASGTSDNVYAWDWDGVEVLTDRRPTISVWLANSNFTNTRASYWVGHYYPNTLKRIGYLNQNTAISGWNSLGRPSEEVYINHFGLEVDSYDNNGNTNTSTGADYIRFVENSTLLLDGDTVLYPSDPEVKKIQNLMLNSIDHFDEASGSFNIYFSNIQQDQTIEFEVKQTDTPKSYEKISNAIGGQTEHQFDGSELVSVFHQTKSFERSVVLIDFEETSPMYLKNQEGEVTVITRQSPSWAHSANEVLHPQNYAFWLTETKNEVIGYEELFDRKVAVIRGVQQDYLADKLGADTFEMRIDVETGILLKLEGFNTQGDVAFSIIVNEIKINQGTNQLKLNSELVIPSDYTEKTRTR